MNFNLLETFVNTVEKGTLSAAAAEMHLTQPAVSKHLRALETYYGVRLLDRMGREVKPTQAGRFLYRAAKEILSCLARTRQELAGIAQFLQGELILGASTTPGQYFLPQLIGAFKKEYPQVKVSLTIGDTQEIIKGVQEGEFDLGVVGASGRFRSLSFWRLAFDEIILIAPPEHRLAGLNEVAPVDLEGELFVWREAGSGTRHIVEERLATAGIDPPANIVMTLGSTEAVVNAVEAGLGCSFVTRRAAEKSIKLGRLAVLGLQGVDLKRELFLVRRRKEQPPAVEVFCNFLECRANLTASR
jgi:DNA-binding transcriptional LysR family regulator